MRFIRFLILAIAEALMRVLREHHREYRAGVRQTLEPDLPTVMVRHDGSADGESESQSRAGTSRREPEVEESV